MSDAASPKSVPPQQAILQMASGYWISQSLYAATKLGIADLVAGGGAPAKTLPTSPKPMPHLSIDYCAPWRVLVYSPRMSNMASGLHLLPNVC